MSYMRKMARSKPAPTSGASGTGTGFKMEQDPFCQKLFERESSKDLVIVAGNGAELKCHRVIFEAQSDALAAMVAPASGMLESRTGRVKLPGNSEEGLGHLIRYLYGLKIPTQEMSFDVVVELFKTAHQYELKELQVHLQGLISGKVANLKWFTPDEILELYFHLKDGDEFEKFRGALVRVMAGIPEKLRASERYKGLTREELEHLLWKLFETGMGRPTTSKEGVDDDDGSFCPYCGGETDYNSFCPDCDFDN